MWQLNHTVLSALFDHISEDAVYKSGAAAAFKYTHCGQQPARCC